MCKMKQKSHIDECLLFCISLYVYFSNHSKIIIIIIIFKITFTYITFYNLIFNFLELDFEGKKRKITTFESQL